MWKLCAAALATLAACGSGVSSNPGRSNVIDASGLDTTFEDGPVDAPVAPAADAGDVASYDVGSPGSPPDAPAPDSEAADLPQVEATDSLLADVSAPAPDVLPVAFDPLSATVPLLIWLDGSRRDSVVLQDGRVQAWNDLSGSGNHAQAPNVGRRPVLVEGDGQPSRVSFDEFRFLRIEDRPGLRSTAMTLVVVCKSQSQRLPIVGVPIMDPSTAPLVLEDAQVPIETALVEPFWDWVFFHTYEDRINVRIGFDSVDGPINGGWGQLSVYSYRTEARDIFRNGTLYYRHGGDRPIAYTDANHGIFVGGFRGEIAELLLFAGTLPESERRDLERRLMTRWNLAP